MKKIIYYITIFTLALAITFTAFGDSFSNLMVLGDSLSDIGNLPAAANSSLDNFYIPISNPVNQETEAYSVPITTLFHLQHPPYQYHDFMIHEEPFLQSQPLIDGEQRLYRSMLWNEFFLVDAYQDNLTQSQTLIPWTYIATKAYKTTMNDSVNYAWASALSVNYCHDRYFNKKAVACDKSHIIAAWQKYFNDPAKRIEQILVPGLLAQVQLLINDVQSNQVSVNSNTIYTIWIGGNDLSSNFNRLQHGENVHEIIEAIKNLVHTIAANNRTAILQLINNPAIKAKHIYVFETFDVTLTPRIYHWNKILQMIGTEFVALYNLELRLWVKQIQKDNPDVSIHIVPTYKWTRDFASGNPPYQSLQFHDTIGQACEKNNPEYAKPYASLDNCKGYLFWNDIHPAMPFEQLVGYLFKEEVAKTLEQKATSQSYSRHLSEAQERKIIWKKIDTETSRYEAEFNKVSLR